MMQLHRTRQWTRANRLGAQGLLALVAGLSMTAAWPSQIVSIGDRKIVSPPPVATSTRPAPTAPTSTPATPASAPASAPKR